MNIEHVTDLWRLDARLAALGRGVGSMRLRIGERLSQLESLGGMQALGYPTLESYAREALGRSGRWAADARSLARRLEALPPLRTALLSGDLSTSMVELVARVATSENAAEWVARARRMTVRAMRVHLRTERMAALDDEEALPRTSLSLTVTRVEALAFERARMLVEAVGATRGDGAIEAMLAEGLGELLARDGDVDLPSGICEPHAPDAAERAELSLLREAAEAAAESAVPPEDVDMVPVADVQEAPVAHEVASVDAALREAAAELAARDVELAQLARRALELELWRVLRFASFDHYCRERMGLSPSSVATRIALARRLDNLPAVTEALVSGRIGYEAATLVARVASPTTVHAWVERAAERTVKHLREEIDAVELVARVYQHDIRQLGPQDDPTLAEVQAVERSALRLVMGPTSDEGQMSGGAPEAAALPTTTLRLSLGADVAGFWRGLELLHRQRREHESFVAFLVRAVGKSWAHGTRNVAYADVYARDRWRCASPVCRARDVTPHHVIFRAHGGGEARGNLVSLCPKCHLELVHAHRVAVSGDADAGLVWRAAGWSVSGRCHRKMGAHGSAEPARPLQ